jgi:hypothetical protein
MRTVTIMRAGIVFVSGLFALLLVALGAACFLDRPNEEAYALALDLFKKKSFLIKNKQHIAVVDYTKPSFVRRLCVYDTENNTVEKHLVSHAKKSGYVYASDFSNEISSEKSSKGFFLTGAVYQGKHGRSLRLKGLEKGINDNALVRGIVIHGAEYVSWKSILANRGRLGRSLGCPAVSMKIIDEVIDKLKGGSLVYVHTEK